MGLARTDNPFYPFVITLLDESGLAFRSGAVHLGDYLVAVNDLDLSGCTLQQLQDTLDSLPNDSLVVLRLCRVANLQTSNTDLARERNSNGKAGDRTGGQQHGNQTNGGGSGKGFGKSPGGGSTGDDSSSGAGRSPNSHKDGGSSMASSEHDSHVRSVDSAICSEHTSKHQLNHPQPHNPINLSDLLNQSLSMSRTSCYDNLKLDPNSGDWIPSSSPNNISTIQNTPNNRHLLHQIETAIWEMDVAKVRDTTRLGLSNDILRSKTLPPAKNSRPETILKNKEFMRESKSFGMDAPAKPMQPPHILTANVQSKPVYLATEHFFTNGSYQITSATQTEIPRRAVSQRQPSPAFESASSSSPTVLDCEDLLKSLNHRPSKYIDDSPIPHVDNVNSTVAPLHYGETVCEETTEIVVKTEQTENVATPSPKPFKKSASSRSFRRVSNAIIKKFMPTKQRKNSASASVATSTNVL